MKIKIIVVLLLVITIATNAQDFEQAKKYLKLASSLIDNQDYNRAIAYINDAKEILSKSKRKQEVYWLGFADELMGKYFLRIGDYKLARDYYQKAYEKYSKVISQPDGSPFVMKDIMSKIDGDSFGSSKSLVLTSKKEYDAFVKTLGAGNLDYDYVAIINCNLKDVPFFIQQMKNLKVLILSDNKIRDLSFSNLPSGLQYLDISNNGIRNFYGSMGNFKDLKYFIVKNNSFGSLPNNLDHLKQLEVLDLRGNDKIPFNSVKSILQNLNSTLILHDEFVPIKGQTATDEEE